MIGLSVEEQRSAFEEDVDVLMAILRGEEVTAKTSRYNLVEARTQYAPYSDFDIVVAAIASPTGPRAAAKNGVHLMSVGATAKGGFDALALHWDVMEERAPQFGHTPDRSKWRLAGRCTWPRPASRRSRTSATASTRGATTPRTCSPPRTSGPPASTFEERVSWVNDTGLGVIGTPDEAIAQIERLEKQSGGFGSYLLIHHEWARHEATLKSYELFANHVKPRFQGSTDRLQNASDYAVSRWQELDERPATRSRPPPTGTRRSARGNSRGTGQTQMGRDPVSPQHEHWRTVADDNQLLNVHQASVLCWLLV